MVSIWKSRALLTDNWQLAAGYTYTQTQYVSDANAAREGEDFDRKKPRQLFKLSTIYTLPGELQRWRVGVMSINKAASAPREGRRYGLEKRAGFVHRGWFGSRLQGQRATGLAGQRQQPVRSCVLQQRGQWGYSPYDIYGDPRNMKLTARYSF